MYATLCPVCNCELTTGYKAWHVLCRQCRYEGARFEPVINSSSAHLLIDERAREMGLKELRNSNFREILTSIKLLTPRGGRLLDVGCAHGWFLALAKGDFDVLGIEPDEAVFNATFARGLPVRLGYFPCVLDDQETFDVIAFNDVIEHIPDIGDILETCHHQLNKNGLLVLNLPSSSGIFYKLSSILARLGFDNFFERLWQVGLPSPHLHYFNTRNIVKLLESKGFDLKIRGNLATVRLSGLYTRVSYTGKLGPISRALIYATVALSLPFLKLLPSDIIYVVATKSSDVNA